VIAAVKYVAALSEVDRKRVATIGCSFGGIKSVFAAEQGTGLVAAVDFAGAAMSWATEPPLQQRMITAVRNAKVPILFLQTENDFDTAPSKVLSEEVKKAGKPMQVHIYPPNGKSHQAGHGGFCFDEHPRWEMKCSRFSPRTCRSHPDPWPRRVLSTRTPPLFLRAVSCIG
jgi:dienelactone hydrolase